MADESTADWVRRMIADQEAVLADANVSPKEVRKTFWHVVGGLILLILAFRLPEILAVLLR